MRDLLRRAFTVRGALVIILGLLAPAACRRGSEHVAQEVTIAATVGALPLQVLSTAAAQRGIARVRAVERAEDADLIWAGDPTEILANAALVAADAAPEVADVDAKFRDGARRFAPVCARARVLVVNPRVAIPIAPRNLRDLADPRLAGRIALPPDHDPAHVTALAVLASVHGEASVKRFLDLLGRNRPLRASSDLEVTAAVGRGEAAVGLVGSEAGAAGAISAAGLEVVVPDQSGRGAVIVPTAVALTRRGVARPEARALAGYLVGADAERLLVARVPGLMPLRSDVPLPPGVRPAGNLVSLPLSWERVAEERKRLLDRLAR
jgi:iron(III) transport system substrate-binding protein